MQNKQGKVKSSSLQKQSGNHSNSKDNVTKKEQKKHNNIQKKGKIILGVCAMKKKVESKPMKQILSRIECKQIKILLMWQYLDLHWTKWPKVDALICFYSDGFPYLMAWRYVKAHSPLLINNLEKQQLLWDRTVVYDILKKIKVPVAKHYYIYRDKNYIDKIEQKAFGKVIPDPLSYDIPQHYNLRVRSIQSNMDYHQFKQKSCHSSHMENTKYENHMISEIQQTRALHHNSSIDNPPELSLKNKSKFSQIETIQQDSEYPTLLRRFAEKRDAHIKKYQVEECDDFVLLKWGDQVKKLKKPLVQKPFDSQDHQICIYYPQSMGGGRKKLFRKIKDQSSQYQSLNEIRKDTNYIYQQFLPTNAFDIKIYTIGPYYMYAQARRSPTLDGVVQRNEEGKQVRYPVILTPDQKFICNKIVQQFQQQICGFDMLRSNGRSYVCDVNGWSFVKGNPKYWEDCASILKKKIMSHFFPGRYKGSPYIEGFNNRFSGQDKLPMDSLSLNVPAPTPIEQLRSIVSIFRHGDRSPKLKLKIKTTDSRFIQFFKNNQKDELKYKDASHLTQCLNITNSIIAALEEDDPLLKDYMQMKIVLQSRGHFDGLTRKLQLKVLQRENGEGEMKGSVKKILIVLKWGGELSYTGYLEAISLGEKMRKESYDDHDCLSLYSSYRHDVKTYASDEGRCIKTAAAFLKGFLSIEGELAPIISSMVMADSKAQRLLDCTSSQNHSSLSDELQQRLSEMLNGQEELMASYLKYCGESSISQAMKECIAAIGHPRKILSLLHGYLKDLTKQINCVYQQNYEEEEIKQRRSHYDQLVDQENCEKIVLIDGRWTKLRKQFYDSQTGKYNVSKISDIYDTIKHDLKKNSIIFKNINKNLLDELHDTSKLLANFVVVNEYGICDSERLKVAQDICMPLIQKMKVDLMFWKQKSSQDILWKYRNNAEIDNWRHIRTRLYFTSASHMYSLLNILTLGQEKFLLSKTPQEERKRINNILFLGYLSHIEFRLYENLTMEENNPNRFRLQISLSSEYKENKQMKEFSLGGNVGFTINQINDFLQGFIVKSEKQAREHNAKKQQSQ